MALPSNILEKHFPTPEGHPDTEAIISAMEEYANAKVTEYATKAQKLADQLQKLNEAVQHLFDIRKEKNKKNQVLNAWNDVALNLQDSKKLLSSWNEGKDYVRLNCMGCGNDFYGPEPKMCCDGRECGCMGQPTEPVVCSQECYDKVTDKQKLARTVVAIAEEVSKDAESAEAYLKSEGVDVEKVKEDGRYILWKAELVKLVSDATGESTIKINDKEARKWYDDGATPYQTFRETWNME